MNHLRRQPSGESFELSSRLRVVAYSAALMLLSCMPASASMGGYHQCSSANGQYSIDFGHGSGELLETGSTTSHSYVELGRTVLESRKSKCRSKTSAQSFDITEERYVLRVRLQERDVELFLYCEQYWDTSPAAACGRDPQRDEVVRHIMLVPKYKKLNGEAEQEGRQSSYWDHNGSIIYLVAHGDRRQFFYHKPRGGMVKAGAEEDSLLFDGETDGKTYEGTAFIFNKRCGQYPYSASRRFTSGRKTLYNERSLSMPLYFSG